MLDAGPRETSGRAVCAIRRPARRVPPYARAPSSVRHGRSAPTGRAPLLLAGKARKPDEAYERQCLAVAASLQRTGRAHVLGQVSHRDVLALMASAHTFAYPSIHEDCPNVVLEALSARRVSVFAEIPAVRELAGDAGVFVRNPDAFSLARALDEALFDAGQRSRVSAEAARRADLFTAAVLDEAHAT
jgi:glycosyltransferase involved in cell wall biosynthesis